jgi:hypothetical protein
MRLLRYKDLHADGIVSNRHDLACKIEDQGFPQPLELGPNKIAWLESEIDEWLESRPRRTPKTGPAFGKDDVNVSNSPRCPSSHRTPRKANQPPQLAAGKQPAAVVETSSGQRPAAVVGGA